MVGSGLRLVVGFVCPCPLWLGSWVGVFGLGLWCCPSFASCLWCSWLGLGVGLLSGPVWFRARFPCPRRFRFRCAVWACVLGPGLGCAPPFLAWLSGCVFCAFFFFFFSPVAGCPCPGPCGLSPRLLFFGLGGLLLFFFFLLVLVPLFPLGRCSWLGVAGFGWVVPLCLFGGPVFGAFWVGGLASLCVFGGRFGGCGLFRAAPASPFLFFFFFWGGGGAPGCSSLCLPSAGACSVAGVWCGWSLATPGGGSCVLLPATPGWVSLPLVVGGPRHSWLGSAGGGGVWCVALVCWWGCGCCVVWLVPRHSWRRFLCATPRHSWLGFAAAGGGRSPPLLAGVLRRWCVVCGVWRWCVGGVVAGVWCGWSLATPGGGSCVLLPATPGWVSLPLVVGGPRHSWLGSACGGVCGVWCVAVVCWWGCGWCVVWLVPRHSWRRLLCATPRHSWLGFAAAGGGRSPPLLAGVRLRLWCVVCGGGVFLGLWLVCGVVGPSPLLAEVPVCYSPPLLAGFRCRWWWAVPATPGWGPLAASVCGVWRWCVVGVVAGVWCGWSLATPGGGPCVLLPATPGWVSLPLVVGGPRHSWLGTVGGGGVWCVVCCRGPSPLLAEVPVCYSPPLLAGFRCRWWWAVPATPGWGPLAAVVCVLCLAGLGRFVFLLCLAPSGLGLPLSLSLLLPFLVGWGLWCVGWLLPGTCSCAVVRCVLCVLSGFVAPGGRRCLAPVRVPWLWPAACLSGVPRGPAWCAAPRPVRSLSVLRSAFPTPWCLSPPRELAPPALLGGCAGHAEAGREPGSLCLPLAPAEAGALGSLRVVPVRGPAMGLSLAGPSGVGLGLRALRWLACGPGH